MNRNHNKKLIYIYIGTGILFLLFIGIFLQYLSKRPISFSTEKWLNGESTERYLMLDDLEQSYNLIGMRADEIQTLLGEYSIQCKAYLSNNGMVDYHWGYAIRYDDWEGTEVLLIDFKDDIVVNYELAYLSEL